MSPRDDITIIAGGWSVRNVPLDRLAGYVIAVNDAAVHAPRWDCALSMDRLWTENRIDRVRAAGAALPNSAIWIRTSAAQNLKKHQLQSLTIFDCDHETDVFSGPAWRSGNVPRLNGRNSGACAMNLAWHLAPARLFLLGFDMNRAPDGNAYWYPPYPWSSRYGGSSVAKYAAWANGMARVRARFDEIGVEVYNVSPSSAVEAFRKITPADYLRMTR